MKPGRRRSDEKVKKSAAAAHDVGAAKFYNSGGASNKHKRSGSRGGQDVD